MFLRAICAASLMTLASATQEAPGVRDAILSTTSAATGAMTQPASATGLGAGRAAVARWDGKEISEGRAVRGLKASSLRTIETWREFAAKRGYRMDLDESQRILVISEGERFPSFASSERIVDRVLDSMANFEGVSDKGPLVVLRAKDERDAETAEEGAAAMGIDHGLKVFVENGSRRDVRAVNARLAESVVEIELAANQPFLSAWMVDGLASLFAEDATGRLIVDGKAQTLRAVRTSVSRELGDIDRDEVDLARIAGVRRGEFGDPDEAQAVAFLAVLMDMDEEAFVTAVRALGQRAHSEATAKFRQEEEAIELTFGDGVMGEAMTRMRRGK